jgi:ketosteroid isomerase-like protein
MSHENVEIARQIIECVNRADDEGLAALMADDVECFPGPAQPEPPFRGRDAFLRYIRGWTDAFDNYTVESCEYLDCGEYVIIVGRTVARGRVSGAEVSSDGDMWVLRFRDGSAVEYREYESRQETLKALGLSE